MNRNKADSRRNEEDQAFLVTLVAQVTKAVVKELNL